MFVNPRWVASNNDPIGVTLYLRPVNHEVAFTDVKTGEYYQDAVHWVVKYGITSGTSKTAFSPNATCSKAQILTFLWRAKGSPDTTATNSFTDVKTTDYFYKVALWAAENGLVSGSTFGANTDCTRAMTMDYMWKAAGRPTPVLTAYGLFFQVQEILDLMTLVHRE